MNSIDRIHNACEIIQTKNTLYINDQPAASSGIFRKLSKVILVRA